MDPTFPLVPIANFLGFLLVLLCVYGSSLSSWNTGVHMYAIWVALECLIRGINCIVWRGTVRNMAPIWCDISTHIDIAAGVGIPACSLVITRRLYQVARLRTDMHQEKYKRLFFDLSICLGLPAIAMGLYYVIQASRYQIFEDIGCTNSSSTTGLAIIIITMWGMILPIISIALYCPKIIWTFYHQRKAVNEFLDSGAGMGRMQYMRVMFLGCADAIVVLPMNIAGALLAAFQQHLQFWPGWEKVHKHYNFIPKTRAKLLEESGAALNITLHWMEWQNVFLAVLFFLLFGLTDEACRRYRKPSRKLFGGWRSKERGESKIVFKSVDIPTLVPASPMSIYYSPAANTRHQNAAVPSPSSGKDLENGKITSISVSSISLGEREKFPRYSTEDSSEQLVRHITDVQRTLSGNRF